MPIYCDRGRETLGGGDRRAEEGRGELGRGEEGEEEREVKEKETKEKNRKEKKRKEKRKRKRGKGIDPTSKGAADVACPYIATAAARPWEGFAPGRRPVSTSKRAAASMTAAVASSGNPLHCPKRVDSMA